MGEAPVLDIRKVSCDSHDLLQLTEALDDELEARYPGLGIHGIATDDPTLVYLLAHLGATPVGCVVLRPLSETLAEVKRMFVVPEARGRGIARRLLTAVEAEARSAGFARLVLETGVRQPEAIALYESSGFRRIPCFGEYEGGTLNVCFEKSLE